MNVDSWGNRLPKDWRVSRLARYARIFAGGTPDRENPDYWTDGDIPWVNSGSVNQFDIVEPSELITQAGMAGSAARWVPKDALLVALAGQGKTKGMAAQLRIRATCNQSMAAIVTNERLSARFLLWWLTSNYANLRKMGGGDLRDGLNLQHVASIPVPLPGLDEQRRIAEFLDRETAQIDELIAKQEQLISTLAERRTSVILNGVARGLSGVELKESGADWLGKVPAHWRVRRLKYSVRFSKNGVWGDEPDGGESDVWVIRVADFDRVRRTVTKDKQTYRKVLNSDRAGRLLEPGDLVLEKSGGGEKSPVGFVAIYEDSEPALTSNFVARLRLEPDCDSRYWLYVHAALYASRVTERSIKQTSGIQNLDQSSYFNELAPFPPPEEQGSIAREIDTRLDAILAAASKAELLIDRLRERRQALISAAVTGHIDVAGAS